MLQPQRAGGQTLFCRPLQHAWARTVEDLHRLIRKTCEGVGPVWGYYSAPAISNAARIWSLPEHGRRFPTPNKNLLTCHGVGPYTAAGLRIAFDQPALLSMAISSGCSHGFFEMPLPALAKV